MTTKQLAMDGGTPVRTEPLPKPYLGASVIGDDELMLLREVVETKAPFRAYGMNPPHMVDDFEKELRAYFGVNHALATATGSGSFCCAMAGLGVGPGDEVIIPSFSWHTDFAAPVLLGATPIFADIDASLNMDPDDFQRKITARTKAVIVVHFQGASHNIDSIVEIAHARGIKVVEDCAQACGAGFGSRKLGSIGDVCCVSMQQNKVITSGDGGFLLTNDPEIFERAARFHDLGGLRPALEAQLSDGPSVEPFAGSQFRMNEFTGAVALAQLRKLDSAILSHTRNQHRFLRERLARDCPGARLRPVDDPDGDAGIAFYMNLETKERADWLIKALHAEGIRTGPSSNCKNLLHDPIVQNRSMAHQSLPPFGHGWPGEHIRYTPADCPNTDQILSKMVCIALAPNYSERDLEDIATALAKVWQRIPERVSA